MRHEKLMIFALRTSQFFIVKSIDSDPIDPFIPTIQREGQLKTHGSLFLFRPASVLM